MPPNNRTMSLLRLLIHGQLTVCALSLLLSLCLIIPIGLHETNFGGHCILFSNGTRNESGYLNVTWASSAPCHYSLVVGLLMLAASLFMGNRLAKYLYRSSEGTFFTSFVDLVISSCLTVMTMVSAIVITLGFKAYCDTIISGYQSCAGASVQGIDKYDLESLSSFYLQMGTAQFGAWSTWVCCVALTVCSLLRSCWHHQTENLKASMAKERQRLLKGGYDPLEDDDD
ncbi:hypothetical protein CHUAL_010060 [Chamberlinius hualienensis]